MRGLSILSSLLLIPIGTYVFDLYLGRLLGFVLFFLPYPLALFSPFSLLVHGVHCVGWGGAGLDPTKLDGLLHVDCQLVVSKVSLTRSSRCSLALFGVLMPRFFLYALC